MRADVPLLQDVSRGWEMAESNRQYSQSHDPAIDRPLALWLDCSSLVRFDFQMYSYLLKHRSRFLDTLHIVMVVWDVYYFTITHAVSPNFDDMSSWLSGVCDILTYVC